MARAKQKAVQDIPAAAPQRRLRSKGPLGPAETEVIVYAGLRKGQIAPTPTNIEIRSRSVFNLIADRAEIADQISHRNFFQVADTPGLRSKMLDIFFSRDALSANDNQAAVAGGLDLINSALGDAYKIILFVDGDDARLPEILSDWKSTKPDSRTTPPSITLVRD